MRWGRCPQGILTLIDRRYLMQKHFGKCARRRYMETPLLLEEEFGDVTIRFAHRGLRWVKMAHAVGISVAGLRARQGYGFRRPNHTTHLFPPATNSAAPRHDTWKR